MASDSNGLFKSNSNELTQSDSNGLKVCKCQNSNTINKTGNDTLKDSKVLSQEMLKLTSILKCECQNNNT